eukprot:1586302-Amphidinium_carterae.1
MSQARGAVTADLASACLKRSKSLMLEDSLTSGFAAHQIWCSAQKRASSYRSCLLLLPETLEAGGGGVLHATQSKPERKMQLSLSQNQPAMVWDALFDCLHWVHPGSTVA